MNLERCRPFVCMLVFFLNIIVTLPIFAATNAVTPISQLTMPSGGEVLSRTQVQNALTSLSKQKNLSTEDKQIEQVLNKTLAFLDEQDRLKEAATALKQQEDQAPAKREQAINALNVFKNDTPLVPSEAALMALSLPQLEGKMNAAQDHLQAAQSDLANYSTQLISLQTQPESIQNSMYAATQRMQAIRSELNVLLSTSTVTPLRNTQQNLLQTELILLNQKIEFQRKQLAANVTLQDVLQKQRDYTTAFVIQQEKMVQALQEGISRKRLTQSEQMINNTQSADHSEAKSNPLFNQALSANNELSQRLLTSTESVNTLTQENTRVKNWLDRSQQAERNLKEQITVLKGTILLSRILYQQQQDLPDPASTADISNRIADLRLEQFEINQKRDALFQGETFFQQLGLKGSEPTDEQINNTLGELVDVRRELLDRLNRQLGEELRLSINLQINQQQLLSVNRSLEDTLKQQIFWVNSNKPMGLEWIKSLPKAIQAELVSFSYTLKPDKIVNGLLDSGMQLLPLLFLFCLLRWWRKAINRKLAALSSEVGTFRKDSQGHTPLAILLTLINTLPGVLVIIGVGLFLSETDAVYSEFLWDVSKRIALGWLVLMGLYNLLSKGGVYEAHFLVSSQKIRYYRKRLALLGIAILPLIFWSAMGERYPLRLVDDVIGQLVVTFILFSLTILLFPSCREAWKARSLHSIRLVIITLISLLPLALLGLMIAGYFYTTLKLSRHWIDSLYLMILWSITHSSAVRGLNVAARRLAYRRAQARRQNLSKEGAEGGEIPEEVPLGLEQINQQTSRFTIMALFMLFTFFLYGVWSDVFTVFSYLDSISLWNYSTTGVAGAVIQSVTLGNLLFAILILIIAYAMTHNLPGLLEVLILSRLPLRQGTSYAFTTILTYFITAIGVISASGVLGVSWDKLQWLVAALSVGLGFGLQEIFANFVSGLIILFERPIRIGDTITIGTYSGTISKIRIRATTITDFDRKEIIVPNKAFVTERLINWSLSDTVTRLVVHLGVAYGSDLEKVKEILLKAAAENERVMADPEPLVFFLNFGPSTLEHELRLYVRELRDRSYAVDELNRRIDQLCRENNITVAFNQLDVYLHNKHGDEIKAQSSKS